MAALAWAAARSGGRPGDPATVAMRSWASRTTQRYQGSFFAVADFEDESSLPTGPSTCLLQYLSPKVSLGVARLTLRNVVSAVPGAEDLGIMPSTVLPIHWRLAKGGLSLGRQPYFSPPAPSFLAQAARTREQRVALGLVFLSYVLTSRPASVQHGFLHRYQSGGGIGRETSAGPLGSWLGCLSLGSGGCFSGPGTTIRGARSVGTGGDH